jgi:hypothetical protein
MFCAFATLFLRMVFPPCLPGDNRSDIHGRSATTCTALHILCSSPYPDRNKQFPRLTTRSMTIPVTSQVRVRPWFNYSSDRRSYRLPCRRIALDLDKFQRIVWTRSRDLAGAVGGRIFGIQPDEPTPCTRLLIHDLLNHAVLLSTGRLSDPLTTHAKALGIPGLHLALGATGVFQCLLSVSRQCTAHN